MYIILFKKSTKKQSISNKISYLQTDALIVPMNELAHLLRTSTTGIVVKGFTSQFNHENRQRACKHDNDVVPRILKTPQTTLHTRTSGFHYRAAFRREGGRWWWVGHPTGQMEIRRLLFFQRPPREASVAWDGAAAPSVPRGRMTVVLAGVDRQAGVLPSAPSTGRDGWSWFGRAEVMLVNFGGHRIAPNRTCAAKMWYSLFVKAPGLVGSVGQKRRLQMARKSENCSSKFNPTK